jgi:hypothetical protein
MPRLAEVPWSAAILFLCAAAVWRLATATQPWVRVNLHLAAALYASLAAAAAFALAPETVAPLATALAAAFLALAVRGSFRRPVKPALAVVLAGGAGLCALGSAFSGVTAVAIVPQLVCQLMMLTVSRRGLMRLRAPSIELAIGALALFAASCTLFLAKPLQGLCLFAGAGQLGVALAVARISDTFVRKAGVRKAGAAKPTPTIHWR